MCVCVCVCGWVSEWGRKEGRGERWGSSSLHQMRLSAGTLLSQTGTHLPMVSCEVLREGRNKGAKRLCDNEGAPRRAFKCGTQAARDKLCQSLRNYFFVQSGGLVWAFMERCKDTSSHGELLSWPLSSSQHKYIVNHLLLCWFDCNKKTCGPIREGKKKKTPMRFYRDSKVYFSNTQVICVVKIQCGVVLKSC